MPCRKKGDPMKATVLTLALLMTGCAQTITVPVSTATKTAHTYKVLYSSNYMAWLDENGFGCGSIERTNNGLVYSAHVVDWSGKNQAIDANFNSFDDAVHFVEGWCKP